MMIFLNILLYVHSKQGYTHLTGIYKQKQDLIDFFQTMHLFSFYRLRGSENFHYPLVYKMNILRPWRDFCGFLGRYWAILSEHMFKFDVLDFYKIS